MALNASKRPFSVYADTTVDSASPSSKKPCFDGPALDKISLWNMATALPLATTQAILFQICHDNPSLSASVVEAHNTQLAAERAKPAISFDTYSKSCWYTLNKKYKRKSSSAQYDLVGDVMEELESAREAILEQAHANTKWETRRNALEVLRKISKSIMLCEEQVIKHELMKDGVELGCFADAMARLAREMTEQERNRYKEEGLYEKLVELQTLCDWETDMEGLRELYEIFDGEDDGEGGEDDNEDGEDNDGDGGSESSDSRVIVLSTAQRTKVLSVGELL